MPALVSDIQGYSIHDGPGIRTIVFLKGCGLECQWCSNPECISPRPEVGFYPSLCTRCGKCAGKCPENALTFSADQLPQIDRNACSGCGKCSSACAYQALVLFGRRLAVDEVFDAVVRDKLFYDASGGGVTISGGECLLQPQFVSELLEKCRRSAIRTCIETSGYAAESALRQVLQYADNLLFDLKHQNPDKHRRLTGVSNELILANARVAAASGVDLLFRMPLIPNINDDEQNLRETAAFLLQLGIRNPRIELMPYHRLGTGKYKALDRSPRLSKVPIPGAIEMEKAKTTLHQLGIQCSIST